MLLDALGGCAKDPIKMFFFEHPVARCRRNRKNKKKKEGQKSNTHFLGGLENGQEVVPPFFSQKLGFSKSSKTLFLLCFPKKWWQPFFKGYVTRRTDIEGQKT